MSCHCLTIYLPWINTVKNAYIWVSKYVSVSGIIHKLFWNVMYQKRRINIGNILIHSIYVWFDVDVPIILNLSIINKCVLLIDLCMALLLWMSCLKAHNNVFSGSRRVICLSIIQDYSLPYIKNQNCIEVWVCKYILIFYSYHYWSENIIHIKLP